MQSAASWRPAPSAAVEIVTAPMGARSTMVRRGTMNARSLLAAAALLAACSDDTGILVEVHGDQLSLAVARLETMVIVGEDAAPAPSAADWGASERVQTTVSGGADLRQRPFTVLLRSEGVPLDRPVWVAALAYDGAGALIAWGQVEGGSSFSAGLIKRVALHLRGVQELAGCVIKDRTVVLRQVDDCDGDQSPYWEDCDDLDPAIGPDLDGDPVRCGDDCDITDGEVYPGAPEFCDGKDNDCDPETQPPPLLCATVERDGGNIVACRLGQRLCDEAGASPSYGLCLAAPVDVAVNDRHCHRWAECAADADPSCLVDHELRCKVPFDEGVACVPAIAPLRDLLGPSLPAECAWRLIGNVQQGGWNLGLRLSGSTGPPTTFVGSCDAELVVTAADDTARLVVLEAVAGDVSRLVAVLLTPRRGACHAGGVTEMVCEVDP
jgi:hypothetical protein